MNAGVSIIVCLLWSSGWGETLKMTTTQLVETSVIPTLFLKTTLRLSTRTFIYLKAGWRYLYFHVCLSTHLIKRRFRQFRHIYIQVHLYNLCKHFTTKDYFDCNQKTFQSWSVRRNITLGATAQMKVLNEYILMALFV